MTKLIRLMFSPERDEPDAIKAKQVGVLAGVAKTWRAFLEVPSPAVQKEENEKPVLAEFKMRIIALAKSGFAQANDFCDAFAAQETGGHGQLVFAKAQAKGAAWVMNDSGDLRDNDSFREDVCFFIWMNWRELRFFRSMSDLKHALAELMATPVSVKNLEKICREIGLRFKGRGRPKNPTRINNLVGIKKSDAPVKRGNGDSRHRRKTSD